MVPNPDDSGSSGQSDEDSGSESIANLLLSTYAETSNNYTNDQSKLENEYIYKWIDEKKKLFLLSWKWNIIIW